MCLSKELKFYSLILGLADSRISMCLLVYTVDHVIQVASHENENVFLHKGSQQEGWRAQEL